jgi:hypothetical protein
MVLVLCICDILRGFKPRGLSERALRIRSIQDLIIWESVFG